MKVGVLISGSGTNLQALLDAAADKAFPADIAVVISNRPAAYGLERAKASGVPTVFLGHRQHDSREAYDAALVAALRDHGVEWVCLAGFMRLITPVFLDAFPNRVLNIHPSLLPSFVGLHAQQQAFDYGTTVAGCTVHFVDAQTDHGPIVAQGVVPVLQEDDADAVQQRILAMEHRLFPMALRWAAEGRLHVEGRKVRVDLRPGESRALFG